METKKSDYGFVKAAGAIVSVLCWISIILIPVGVMIGIGVAILDSNEKMLNIMEAQKR